MSSSAPDELLWSPPADRRTNMDAFIEFVNSKHNLNLDGSYKQLYEWSVDQYADFWEDFYAFSGIVTSQAYTRVVDTSKGVKDVPEWFSGARLNFAENLLKFSDKYPDKPAIIVAGEGLDTKKISFSELKCRVSRLVSALRSHGVQRGDKVVGYIPNCALAVEAMLACVSLGAIWSSASPDFGVTGVVDRFSQIKPKIIFSVNGVRYNNKVHMHLDKLRQVVSGLPEVEHVIVMEYVHSDAEMDLSGFKNATSLQTFLAGHDCTGESLEFEQVPFNHPLYIMFSSGTTGPPKCMVHSVGGTLIQHLKEHMLHGNMTHDDVMLYYSTTGWMMWNWLVSALSVGSAIVLYDGSPFVPTPSVLFDLIDKVGITVLGTGAKWISALQERRVEPVRTHKLSSLHTILSTGSPLKPDNFRYVYKSIKKQVCLGSISGGTDIISCFVGQNPKLPVFAGEIQARNLGMAVESWNENGEPVYNRSGELVVTKPFPSQPTHFLNDPGSNKYQKAYFSGYPDVWTHGDYCMINERTGGIVMLGRSDSTLNPSGVRFGSAEIYNIVEMNGEIEDSLCIGQPFKGDERVILFLKMSSGFKLSEELVQRVKLQIRNELSARHVPHLIYETQEIPYTTNGKKVEVAVKKVLCGEEVKSRGSLVNPDALDLYADMYSSYLRADPN